MYKEIFELAKSKGIESLELYIYEGREVAVSLFHSEIDDYRINSDFMLSARGIFEGKMGYVRAEKYDNKTAKFLVDNIIKNAKLITSSDKVSIYAGDKEYKKINVFNPALAEVSMAEKIAFIKQIEKEALAYNPAIVEVASNSYSEASSKVTIINDKGLNLTRENNQIVYYLDVVARKDNEDKTGSYIFVDNDFQKLDTSKIVKEACDEALSKLGSKAVKSGSYDVVLDAKMMSALLGFVVSNCYASNIQDGFSIWKDKLGTKVGGDNFTLIEDPWLENSIVSTGFDDEGVATKPKTIIEKGVLKTYLYNLKRALKDDVKSTGNGYRSGGVVGISVRNAYLVAGKSKKEELFAKMQEGLYVTELQGMHAGLDSISGNFSLQASGYVIKNGQKERPVSVITVAGNLYTMLHNLVELSDEQDFYFNPSIKAPSAWIKGLVIAGL